MERLPKMKHIGHNQEIAMYCVPNRWNRNSFGLINERDAVEKDVTSDSIRDRKM